MIDSHQNKLGTLTTISNSPILKAYFWFGEQGTEPEVPCPFAIPSAQDYQVSWCLSLRGHGFPRKSTVYFLLQIPFLRAVHLSAVYMVLTLAGAGRFVATFVGLFFTIKSKAEPSNLLSVRYGLMNIPLGRIHYFPIQCNRSMLHWYGPYPCTHSINSACQRALCEPALPSRYEFPQVFYPLWNSGWLGVFFCGFLIPTTTVDM